MFSRLWRTFRDSSRRTNKANPLQPFWRKFLTYNGIAVIGIGMNLALGVPRVFETWDRPFPAFTSDPALDVSNFPMVVIAAIALWCALRANRPNDQNQPS